MMADGQQKAEKTYSVAVVATMSAGKSTLLNAMIGKRLLPSKNEACTATVFRIKDEDGRNEFGAAKRKGGALEPEIRPITIQELAEWNMQAPDEIIITGDVRTIRNTEKGLKIEFVDTPGPNNSACADHGKITESIIAGADFASLVVVLNASVAGVEDELRVLNRLRRCLDESGKKLRMIFVVNKIDVLDPEAGEAPVRTIKDIRSYLKELGFKNPIVVPTMGELALTLREAISGMIKYEPGKGGPSVPLKFKKKAYMVQGSPRQQMSLRVGVERIVALREFYRAGFRASREVADALVRVDHTRKLRRLEGVVLIGGKFFKFRDIRSVEKCTGVPILEWFLQRDLEAFENFRRRR